MNVLDEVITLGCDVINQTAGKEVREEWLCFSALMKKVVMHAASANAIINGTPIVLDGASTTVADFSSVHILARASAETFVTFRLLAQARNVPDDWDFRYAAWRYAGFKMRQEFETESDAMRAKQQSEAEMLQRLWGRLTSTRCYDELTKQQKAKLRQPIPDWHPEFTIRELVGQAFRTKPAIYAYLCSYAHSGALSAVQIEEITGDSAAVSLEFGKLMITVVLLQAITLFAEIFPEVQPAVDGMTFGQSDL